MRLRRGSLVSARPDKVSLVGVNNSGPERFQERVVCGITAEGAATARCGSLETGVAARGAVLDISTIEFNANQKVEAAARDAISGLRKLLLGYPAFFAATSMLIHENRHYWQTAEHLPAFVNWGWALLIVSAILLMYGSYQVASALDWEGYISAAMLFFNVLPYLNLTAAILLFVCGLNLVKRANFKFTFVGAPRKRSLGA